MIASGFDQIKLLKRIQLESDDNKVTTVQESFYLKTTFIVYYCNLD